MKTTLPPLIALLCITALATAQNQPAPKPAPRPAPKPAPKLAKDLPAAEQAEVQKAAAQLGTEIEALQRELAGKPELLRLLPDVQIYHNALRYPLAYNEPLDIAKARKAFTDGMARAKELRAGKPEWIHKDGPRGYVSKIDDSVQPYYLLMPTDFAPSAKEKHRLDLFAHGRDEKLTELNFISGKVGNAPATGSGKFVALLYGRFCNANKMAGEIDCFETIDNIAARHPIDRNKLILTGFSMGGGAVWHLTVHYPGVWAATSPGAGFADTTTYQNLAKKGELDAMPWWRKSLLHYYDCTDWALNLANVPCIAYAGDLDKQIQASEVMEAAAAKEGIKLERLIGPKTEHKYEPATRKELDKRLDVYAAKSNADASRKIRFTTQTLRYNECDWLTVLGLEQHWKPARVEASIEGNRITVMTHNVTSLKLTPPLAQQAQLSIDGTTLSFPGPGGACAGQCLIKSQGAWHVYGGLFLDLGKHPGLQGPIDDAFLSRFIIVKPTGKPMHPKTGAWVAAELERAISDWRLVFRGEAIVRDDAAITDADIANSNLVLFGDPSSNKLLARIADKLPCKWNGDKLVMGDQSYPGDTHAPILIFPNPLNPAKYVVLNSGITFRTGNSASNSLQIPMLPDYAIVDVTTPPTKADPGKIVRAGFFGEKWELLEQDGKR